MPQLDQPSCGLDRTNTFFISYEGCVVQLFSSLALGSTECVLLVVMAFFDRYAAVCHPLRYTAIMHPHLCQTLAIALLGRRLHELWFRQASHGYALCGLHLLNHFFFCEMTVLLKLACEDTEGTETKMFVARAIILLFLQY